MAQFYASMQGNRGQATRMGTKNSGLTAHVRGWNIGVRVCLTHRDGEDVVTIYRTNGSNGHSSAEEVIGEYRGEYNGS